MNTLVLKYKYAIAILVILGLGALNYKVITIGLDKEFFGILFSILLFVFGSRKTNFKINYSLLAIIFILEFISYRLHTKSLHFLAYLLFLCLLYYSLTQRFSFIAFICLLLFSSLFNTFFEQLTSEIKQNLCYGVYLSMKNIIPIERIEGVNFYINNAKITIDTACMGLSMFKTGLLAAAIILTLEEKKHQKHFTILSIISFSLIVIFLNILSNYFRIILLLILNCTQENTLHHSVGIVCFILYQLVPMLILVRYFKPITYERPIIKNSKNVLPILFATLLLLLTSIEIKKEQNDTILKELSSEYDINNGIWVNKEVFKIQTPNQLIYIKTPTHKPLICWTGNGYTITETKVITVNQDKKWFAKMEKNGVQYQTIWWYECGNKKYTSFVEVMCMKLIYNHPIRLINVTNRIH